MAFVDALPLTPSQKIQRGELKAMAAQLPGAAALHRHARAEAAGSADMTRRGYDGVALAVPVTVPYVRHSIRGAHWFLGQAVRRLCDASGLKKEQFDGLTVSSFSLAPDTAVGVTQHLGLSPRWLDHIPTGGASGVMAVRRAARAVQAGDADIVACVAADTNHVDSFGRCSAASASSRATPRTPTARAGPTRCSPSSPTTRCARRGATREDFGRICVDQRHNALASGGTLFKRR